MIERVTEGERAAADAHFAPPVHPTSGPCCMTPEAIRQMVEVVWPIAYRAGQMETNG